jgi:hypothetical protein
MDFAMVTPFFYLHRVDVLQKNLLVEEVVRFVVCVLVILLLHDSPHFRHVGE